MRSVSAGVIFGLAITFFFIANELLSPTVAYPLGAMAPGLIVSLWSVLYFHEITGRRNLTILCVAYTTTLIGVACVALSKDLQWQHRQADAASPNDAAPPCPLNGLTKDNNSRSTVESSVDRRLTLELTPVPRRGRGDSICSDNRTCLLPFRKDSPKRDELDNLESRVKILVSRNGYPEECLHLSRLSISYVFHGQDDGRATS